LSICVAAASYQQINAQTAPKATEKHSYKIDLKIDFDRLTYTGVERVRWVNRGEKPTSIIYFHLVSESAHCRTTHSSKWGCRKRTNRESTSSKFVPAQTIHRSSLHSTIRAPRFA
jgi:hypothetical protein